MIKRCLNTIASKQAVNYALCSKIKSWVINGYGDTSELTLNSTRIPIINNADDVLVKVNAASINPIDLLMLHGYAKTLINLRRNADIEFPLILGRDFSGIVIAKGLKVDDSLKIGDEVYGFSPLHKQGTFSEIVAVNKSHVTHIPLNLL